MSGLFAEIFVEEGFNRGKWDYVFAVVEISVACTRNHHEQLVVLLARSDGEFLVGVAAEVERVCLLPVENHDGVLNLTGTAHQREVYPGNRGCCVSSTVGVERAGMIAAFGLVVVVIVAEELGRIVG